MIDVNVIFRSNGIDRTRANFFRVHTRKEIHTQLFDTKQLYHLKSILVKISDGVAVIWVKFTNGTTFDTYYTSSM